MWVCEHLDNTKTVWKCLGKYRKIYRKNGENTDNVYENPDIRDTIGKESTQGKSPELTGIEMNNLLRFHAFNWCVLCQVDKKITACLTFRKWFSERQKLQSSSSVFGSAVCSSADCSRSTVCHIHSRETTAHIQVHKPDQWERPANTQEHKPDQWERAANTQEHKPDQWERAANTQEHKPDQWERAAKKLTSDLVKFI